MKQSFFASLFFITLGFYNLTGINMESSNQPSPSTPPQTLRPSTTQDVANSKSIMDLQNQARQHLNGLLELTLKEGQNQNLRSIYFVKTSKKLRWRDYQAEINKWNHSAFQEWNRIIGSENCSPLTPELKSDILIIKNDAAYPTIEAESELLKTLDNHYWKTATCSFLIPSFFGAAWYAKDQNETIALTVGTLSLIGVLYCMHSTYREYKKLALTKDFYNSFAHFKKWVLESDEVTIPSLKNEK